jgi:hypothetical protein
VIDLGTIPAIARSVIIAKNTATTLLSSVTAMVSVPN